MGLFGGLRSWLLDFLGSGSSLIGHFGGVTISPNSHMPVTNIPEYPPSLYTYRDIYSVRQNCKINIIGQVLSIIKVHTLPYAEVLSYEVHVNGSA